MSDVYSDLESAIAAMLQADAGLAAAVKTFEADVRECLFSGDKLAQGFRPDELPAVNVSAEIRPATRGPFTAGEMELTIPVSVIVIAKAQKKKAARAKLRELQVAIEAVLDQARRSASGLGANAIVTGDITSTIVIVEEKPHHFAIGESQFAVLKIVPLGEN
jgi:hypothetical protein